MIKNYLKIAVRTLRKHRGYAFINITGLAVGIASCLMILIYVMDELKYDRFHQDPERIYRVTTTEFTEAGESRQAVTHAPLSEPLQGTFAGVEKTVRLYPYSALVGRAGRPDLRTQEDRFVFADSTVFDVFNFQLVLGDPVRVFEAPFSLVLTESSAARYFGDTDPIGELMTYRDDEGEYSFTVTGVVQDPPMHTHIHFDMLASFSSLNTTMPWIYNWHYPPLYTYVKLGEGVDAGILEAQLSGLLPSNLAASRSLFLQPLLDIHLYSNLELEWGATSDVRYVIVFSLLAGFILLIACINFMNLATARSTTRVKEVGLRKVLGAARHQLVRQYLTESVLLTGLSMLLALVLVDFMLPFFSEASGKTLQFALFGHWTVPVVLIGLIAFVGVLAGMYPALYLSRFSPGRILKSSPTTRGTSATYLRKGLVVFQFAVSSALIVGTVVIYSQLDYIQNKKLGFNKEHVVIAPLRDEADQLNYYALKQSWLRNADVVSVTGTSEMPGRAARYIYSVVPEDAASDTLEMAVFTIDADYAETLGLEIIAGRDFSEDYPTDISEGILINERAAQMLGWEDPVGKALDVEYHFRGLTQKSGRVVGVVRDFHFNSLHEAIDPVVFHIAPESYYNDYISARIIPGRIEETLAALERGWNGFNPNRPFEYFFLDDSFDTLYRAENRFGLILGFFSLIAICIACLGLFGLASFTTEQRTKEIGVRKVLGASVGDVVLLLSGEFTRLVLIAFLVATPVAYWTMNRWLEGFAYHIELSGWIFLIAGLAALFIAWMTVGYQSIRAAMSNPVEALRYE